MAEARGGLRRRGVVLLERARGIARLGMGPSRSRSATDGPRISSSTSGMSSAPGFDACHGQVRQRVPCAVVMPLCAKGRREHRLRWRAWETGAWRGVALDAAVRGLALGFARSAQPLRSGRARAPCRAIGAAFAPRPERGGIPIVDPSSGRIVGAVGVSGVKPNEDAAVAAGAVQALLGRDPGVLRTSLTPHICEESCEQDVAYFGRRGALAFTAGLRRRPCFHRRILRRLHGADPRIVPTSRISLMCLSGRPCVLRGVWTLLAQVQVLCTVLRAQMELVSDSLG